MNDRSKTLKKMHFNIVEIKCLKAASEIDKAKFLSYFDAFFQ